VEALFSIPAFPDRLIPGGIINPMVSQQDCGSMKWISLWKEPIGKIKSFILFLRFLELMFGDALRDLLIPGRGRRRLLAR